MAHEPGVVPAELAEAKAARRGQIRARRRAAMAQEDYAVRRTAQSSAIARAVLSDLGELRRGDVVAAYRSLPSEPPTEALVAALIAAGIRVIEPVFGPDGDLDWQPWDPDCRHHPSKPGGVGAAGARGPLLGVDAIGDAHLVIVPGLSIGADGTRLGQGGGCYDRALPRRRKGTAAVALVFGEEVVDGPLPVDDRDARVDAVVTAQGDVTWFRRDQRPRPPRS